MAWINLCTENTFSVTPRGLHPPLDALYEDAAVFSVARPTAELKLEMVRICCCVYRSAMGADTCRRLNDKDLQFDLK